MTLTRSKSCTAFNGQELLFSGALLEAALAVKTTLETDATSAVLVFDDETGRIIDLDIRGSEQEIAARLTSQYGVASVAKEEAQPEPRGRGRPKLGVVSREVTLLPRHWEWLAKQPGGASAVLRKLVDEARRHAGPRDAQRATQEAAYQFMHTMAGDLEGYEEAIRALFAGDQEKMQQQMRSWPEDIRHYALQLASRELRS
ncbi:DUF2239 family protein [Paenochrobactrum glaciei]|uniref:DUF2239 family protein n=1 Tax=Paenochrobactrum glaciei TaxID=486407 RepID=A0ABP3RD49_9HYPH